MYVSTETTDCRDIEAIYFNGRKQTHCLEADDVKGYIVRYLTDEAGPVQGPDFKDMTERVKGHVVIRWKAAALARMAGTKTARIDFSAITREIVGR